jgi:hypothetical protein
MSDISEAVNSLIATSNLLKLDMKKVLAMERMIKDILQATEALQSGCEDRHKADSSAHSLSLAISSLGAHGRNMTYEQNLLDGLHFVMIEARHEKIEKAHADTYEWIFRDAMPDGTKIGFSQWLEKGNDIFWIHGKPGCGKSTLMKLICNHGKTREHLNRWRDLHAKSMQDLQGSERDLCLQSEVKHRLGYEAALVKSYREPQRMGEQDGDADIAKLVVAKYFFWNAGSKPQKSQEGLLRSLLFETLRQCPDLVDHVCRARARCRGLEENLGETGLWMTYVGTVSWDFDELLSTLEDVISVRMSATFCFFIDGLDEYEQENKKTYRDLVDTLRRIAKLPNAKVCASGRPWTVFMDAFTSTSASSLKLEDLTRGDIRRYVSDKLEEHDQYQRLRAHDQGYEALIDEVAKRAQGVFLWVHLVVKDLLEGLTYNDSLQTMRERLDQFPEDLEDFFMHMIECIPPVYRRQAARTFLITMEAPHPLLLTLHSFLDDIEADPSFCLARPQLPLESSELDFRHERMRRQLEGRTKGLLEVVHLPGVEDRYYAANVDFLHRTVRDFLRSSGKVQSFMADGHDDFSKIWLLLCQGILAEIRYAPSLFRKLAPHTTLSTRFAMPGRSQQNQLTTWLDQFLLEFTHFAERALDGINSTSALIALFKALEGAIIDGTKSRVCPQDGPEKLARRVCEYGLLELLKQMNLSEEWLTPLTNPDVPPSITSAKPLLLSALVDYKGSSHRQCDIVSYLLQQRADPNFRDPKGGTLGPDSPFLQYMDMLDSAKPIPEEEIHRVFQIVMALVAHGADLSRPLQADPGRRPRLADLGAPRLRQLASGAIIHSKADPRELIMMRFPRELASRILNAAPRVGTEGQNQPSPSAARRDGPSIPGPATARSEIPGQAETPTPVQAPAQSQARTLGRRATLRSKLKRLLCH